MIEAVYKRILISLNTLTFYHFTFETNNLFFSLKNGRNDLVSISGFSKYISIYCRWLSYMTDDSMTFAITFAIYCYINSTTSAQFVTATTKTQVQTESGVSHKKSHRRIFRFNIHIQSWRWQLNIQTTSLYIRILHNLFERWGNVFQ